jgi:predicted metal-dependent phosphoesterase TrpH
MDNINKIQFAKPDLTAITQKFTAVDLHFHTHYSDGMNSIGEIVDRIKELGIGVAITDHNAIDGAVELDRHSEVLSIPGIEITSREGTHILVYFYDIHSLRRFYKTDVEPYMGSDLMSSIALTIEEIVTRARSYKSIIIFPHPFCAAYTGICNRSLTKEQQEMIFEQVDGVEVINSENLKRWNMRCALLGFNLDKAITGGSDGHKLYQLGKVVSYAECKKDRVAFLDAVRNKQVKVVGKEIAIFKKVTSNGFKLKTNFKNYPDIVEKNIRYSCKVINLSSRRLRDNVRRSLNERLWRYDKRYMP